MASDDNRSNGGSRVTQASKLNRGQVEKGTSGVLGAAVQERRTEGREKSFAGVPGAERSRYPSLKPDLADQIGARLRSVYDDVLVQPVPERFLELLRQLESAPGASFARAKKDGT